MSTVQSPTPLRPVPPYAQHGARRELPSVPVRDPGRASLPTLPASHGTKKATVDQQLWFDHLQFARTGDAGALERLVAEYERYARSLARRMHRGGEPGEDLDQVALEALVGALRRFDPERGIPFPAFATPTIIGSLRRHYRDHGWLVRVPRRVHDFAVAERAAIDRLVGRLGRHPSTDELAAELRMDVDHVLEGQEALHARNVGPLESPGFDGQIASGQAGAEDLRFVALEDHITLAQAMRMIDEPAKDLLRLYFFEDRSQAEIGAHLGVSQMQVSRLLSAVLRRLRTEVGPR